MQYLNLSRKTEKEKYASHSSGWFNFLNNVLIFSLIQNQSMIGVETYPKNLIWYFHLGILLKSRKCFWKMIKGCIWPHVVLKIWMYSFWSDTKIAKKLIFGLELKINLCLPQMCLLDENEVRVSGIKVIVDILMFHGSSAFVSDDDKENGSDEDLFEEEEEEDIQVWTSIHSVFKKTFS